MGAKQKDTLDQLRDEAYFGAGGSLNASWDGKSWPTGPETATLDEVEVRFGTEFMESVRDREYAKWNTPFEADRYLQMTHGKEDMEILQVHDGNGGQYWIHVYKNGLPANHALYSGNPSTNNLNTYSETITNQELDAVYDWIKKNSNKDD